MITGTSCATINWKRLSIAIPVAAIANMFLMYALFMNPISHGIIFSDELHQSPKLVAVWTKIDPVPSVFSLSPALVITPAIFSFFFAVLYDSIPGRGKIKKGFAYGIILWAMIAIFFELFTPLGLFGEPLNLLAYELSLWFVDLVSVSLILSMIYSRKLVTHET